MKTRVNPVVAILIVVVAIAVIAGVVWMQSEAPVLNKLPKPMGMGGPPPPPAGADRATSQPEGHQGGAKARPTEPGGAHRQGDATRRGPKDE